MVRLRDAARSAGALLVAAVYKTLQVRAAREWPSTAGQGGGLESRSARGQGDRQRPGRRRTDSKQRNFANIVYEYSVSGKKLRNNRVSIGEDLGNFQVAETIAKYPVGAVVTVYYNSLHPREAVLERDLPKGLWGCLGIGTAIVLAIVFGSAIGLTDHGIRLARIRSRAMSPRRWPSPLSARSSRCSRWSCTGRRRWREMAGGDGHHQTCPASSNTARRRSEGGARPDHVQRKVSYSYRFKDLTYTGARQLASNTRSTSSGCCANPPPIPGWRRRQGLGQSGQSVGGDAQSAHAVRVVACGWLVAGYGAWRITRRCMVRITRNPQRATPAACQGGQSEACRPSRAECLVGTARVRLCPTLRTDASLIYINAIA